MSSLHAIPGLKAMEKVITDTCRTRGGAELDDAMHELRHALLTLANTWPAGEGAKFHILVTVETPGMASA